MTGGWLRGPKRVGTALIDPAGAIRAADRDPGLVPVIATVSLGCAALGAATLPRQLHELWSALAPVGDQIRDAQHALMWHGLLRLAIVDRLLPPPVVVVAALLLVLAVEPVLSLPHDRRRTLWSVVALGLAPLLVLRMGELAITYLPDGSVVRSPGEVLLLPHRFVTGPLLLWTTESAPPWVHIMDARLNLITLWCAGLWAWGLRWLDGRRLAAWHIAVPLAALAGGGLVTWVFTQPVVALILGRP
jgi:hypothetical protein